MTDLITLIPQLQKILDKNGNMPIIACHGSSGTYDPVGSASISEVEEGDDDLLELEEGTFFVCLYTGN